MCNANEKVAQSNPAPNNAYATKSALKHSQKNSDDIDVRNGNSVVQKRGRQLKPSSSLDRRRIQSRSRQERDSKSRSAHSLQESSATSTTDYASPEQPSGIFV